MRDTKPVLLLEDDEVDQESVSRAFKALRITNPLVIAGNGEEGLVYLLDKANKLPCLILLDLKMPRMDGLEFLREIKKDEHLKQIPVVAFTSSKEEQDKVESFKLGVAGYMVKPSAQEKFLEVIHTIDLYWTLSETP